MATYSTQAGTVAVTFDLKEKQVFDKVKAAVSRRLMRAGNYLKNRVMANIGVSGWTGGGGAASATGQAKVTAHKGKGKKRKDYHPSKPGEFPHMDTTLLRKSIYCSEVEEMVGGGQLWIRVGTQLFYGKILELTQRGNGRPFLRRTLKEEEPQIRQILMGKASGAVGEAGVRAMSKTEVTE